MRKELADYATRLLRSRMFLAILALKLVASAVFSSDFPLRLFVPFIQQFVAHPFTDPYAFFVAHGAVNAFPYPPLMLLLFAGPFAALAPFVIGHAAASVFVLRLPLLAADIGIALLLCHLTRGRTTDVVRYYWASPVLFYISYVHGQLDAVPIAFLILSVVLLTSRIRHSLALSFIVLGLGLASKTSVLLAFPFLLLYVWKKKRSLPIVATCAALTAGTFALFVLPFLSEGLVRMVFFSDQQARLFAFSFPLSDQLLLFVAPIAYAGLFLRFAGYRRITPDALMMILSLVFAIFMILVPPRPGWFFWGMPFIAFFFIRIDVVRRFTYWALNAVYFLFFWTWKDADFPRVLQLMWPGAASMPTIHALLGGTAPLVSSLMFSLLASIVLVIAYWIYRYGIRRQDEYLIRNKPVTIGIGGDSGSGKTTLSNILFDTCGTRNTIIVNGDDMHRWARGDEHWRERTHLDPRSNRLHLDYNQALQLSNGKTVMRRSYDHDTGAFTDPQPLVPRRFLIFAGLHPFYLKGMRDMQDIRIFLEPDEGLRRRWKIDRDRSERGHTRAEVLRQLAARRPDTERHILPQRDFATMVVRFSASLSGGASSPSSPLMLDVTLDNTIDTDRFVELLHGTSLQCTQDYDEDCTHQTLHVSGAISAGDVKHLCRTLIPDYALLLDNEPRWHAGLNGVLQMLFIHHLSELQRRRDNHE